MDFSIADHITQIPGIAVTYRLLEGTILFQPRTLSQTKKLILLVWISYIISEFLFVYLANLLARQRAGTGQTFILSTHSSLFAYLFSFLGLVGIVYGLYIHGKLPMVYLKKELKKVTDRAHVPNSDLNDILMARATFLYSIIIGCCYASCGYCGFFLFLFGGSRAFVFPFVVLSLVGLVACWPTKAYYERIAQRVQEWQSHEAEY